MNRGPKKNTRNATLQSFVQKLEARLGRGAPDWLVVLAEFTDANSTRVAGEKLGYSASVVSTVLAGKYPGDLARVEETVNGALMGANVDCLVLGDIGRDWCLKQQKQPFRATGAQRAQLYHACRGGCTNAWSTGGSDEH